MNKKGFTLVELLAVIVILAVILIIAVPQIQSVIKDSKTSTLKNTLKLMISAAEEEYINKKALGIEINTVKCDKIAKLSDKDYGKCKITYDNDGTPTVIINGKKDGKFDNIACSGTRNNITCIQGEIPTLRMCKYDGKLTNGLKFVDGQYTYTYYTATSSFSVTLTDKTSTDPVTTELCGTINGKKITNMSSMFRGSKAISIDLSSFDTSNVLSMSSMFENTKATELNLSSFDTSKVTSMDSMFLGSQATTINLSSFDTSKVTSMDTMFYNAKVVSLDLSSFDTSNVTDMYYMFKDSSVTIGYARTEEDADKLNASSGKPSALSFVVKTT